MTPDAIADRDRTIDALRAALGEAKSFLPSHTAAWNILDNALGQPAESGGREANLMKLDRLRHQAYGCGDDFCGMCDGGSGDEPARREYAAALAAQRPTPTEGDEEAARRVASDLRTRCEHSFCCGDTEGCYCVENIIEGAITAAHERGKPEGREEAYKLWPTIPADWTYSRDFEKGWQSGVNAFRAAIREGKP